MRRNGRTTVVAAASAARGAAAPAAASAAAFAAASLTAVCTRYVAWVLPRRKRVAAGRKAWAAQQQLTSQER